MFDNDFGIEHDRTMTRVFLPGGTITISYNTVIALHPAGEEPAYRENQWGTTTGKHLNSVGGTPDNRDDSDFEAATPLFWASVMAAIARRLSEQHPTNAPLAVICQHTEGATRLLALKRENEKPLPDYEVPALAHTLWAQIAKELDAGGIDSSAFAPIDLTISDAHYDLTVANTQGTGLWIRNIYTTPDEPDRVIQHDRPIII